MSTLEPTRTVSKVDGGRPRSLLLSWGAVVGQLVFTGGWLLAGALEGDGYSVARHDSSDLASLTAHHAALLLTAQAIAGVLTIAFAVGALRPSLAIPGRRSALGAWFVAGSLVGAELLTEVFFRLNCRAADAGCTPGTATGSWPGKLHVIVGFVSLAMTLAAPFALARRMRLLEGWRDLARPSIALGAALVVVIVAYGVFFGSGVSGYLNRAPLLLGSVGVSALALRILRFE